MRTMRSVTRSSKTACAGGNNRYPTAGRRVVFVQATAGLGDQKNRLSSPFRLLSLPPVTRSCFSAGRARSAIPLQAASSYVKATRGRKTCKHRAAFHFRDVAANFPSTRGGICLWALCGRSARIARIRSTVSSRLAPLRSAWRRRSRWTWSSSASMLWCSRSREGFRMSHSFPASDNGNVNAWFPN